MPIDSSIYFKQEAPDIIGSIDKGLRMSDMIEARAEKKAAAAKQNDIKAINMSAMVEDPATGMATFDAKKAASEMVKKGYTAEAAETLKAKQSADMGAAQLTAEQYKNSMAQLESHARDLAVITDQNSLNAALQKYAAAGHDITNVPKVWGPQAQQFIKNEQMKTLTAKERFELANKDRDFSAKQQELAIKRGESNVKKQELSGAQNKQAGLYKMGVTAEQQYKDATTDKKQYDPTQSFQPIDNSRWAPNWMKNDKAIESQAAQDNWIETFLRDASGAAIAQSERGAYADIYFPVAGDTEAVVANKEKLRKEKMDIAAQGAGGKAQESLSEFEEDTKKPAAPPKNSWSTKAKLVDN